MSDEDQTILSEPKRPRPRFSLLTLVLVTTIVSLSVVLWRVGSEVIPLREEVKRLRNEVGELVVEDESKLCAIQVRTDDDLTWKWRIWIPPGKKYKLNCTGERIPKEGFVTRDLGTITLGKSGEYWVTYSIRKDLRDGKWKGTLIYENGSVGSDIHEWVDWPSKMSTASGVGFSTVVHEASQTLTLKRYHVSQEDNSSKIEYPTPGFLIWLD